MMMRQCSFIVILALLAGCAASGASDVDQAQQIAVDYCEREGGEVVTRQEGTTSRQYCHLIEGRVIEVNRLYRAEGLRLH
ncbi:DUF333 domain-containing protein [Halomonas sp. HNIBRBA4712]|uniref:DUF333 domain-containing protein n=1 Tax=Halomonas sp. HNIBRBA4712 TaxID=3373087 RepID=UPI003746D98F